MKKIISISMLMIASTFAIVLANANDDTNLTTPSTSASSTPYGGAPGVSGSTLDGTTPSDHRYGDRNDTVTTPGTNDTTGTNTTTDTGRSSDTNATTPAPQIDGSPTK